MAVQEGVELGAGQEAHGEQVEPEEEAEGAAEEAEHCVDAVGGELEVGAEAG